MHDLVIRGATLYDGGGGEALRADVALQNGRIAEIGQIGASAAARVLEADGLVLMPGIVDVHTHYDAQATWDATLSPSPSLGDARLAPLIPDPAGAARAWQARHGGIQINHMVVVRSPLTRSDPDAVRETYRLLAESRGAAGSPELNPFGGAANRRNLELAIERTHAQGLIARRCAVDELFDEVTRDL